MCGKTAFSKKTVGVVLRRIQNQGKAMRSYQCDKCYRYHLTSDTKEGAKNYGKPKRVR